MTHTPPWHWPPAAPHTFGSHGGGCPPPGLPLLPPPSPKVPLLPPRMSPPSVPLPPPLLPLLAYPLFAPFPHAEMAIAATIATPRAHVGARESALERRCRSETSAAFMPLSMADPPRFS